MERQPAARSPVRGPLSCPRSRQTPADGPGAMFELARLAHEKEAMGKLARALQQRLNSVRLRLEELAKRSTVLLRVVIPNRARRASSPSARPAARHLSDRQSGSDLKRSVDRSPGRTDRQTPSGVKVMSWKF